MKRLFFILIICCLLPLSSYGQQELPKDTIRHSLNVKQPDTKQFGAYQLDMRQINKFAVASPNKMNLSTGNFEFKDFNSLFNMKGETIYNTGFTNDFSRTSLFYPTFYNGYVTNFYGLSQNPDMLQGASFKLNNGARINLYGKYDANGKLLPGMNVLPWQKHDFKAAFEMKTANGHFGFRLEVSKEANPMDGGGF